MAFGLAVRWLRLPQFKVYCPKTVPKPMTLILRELLVEREQIPQVIEIRHFHIECMERLEAGHIFRNQQVAGSSPAGGSTKSIAR